MKILLWLIALVLVYQLIPNSIHKMWTKQGCELGTWIGGTNVDCDSYIKNSK